MSSSSRRSNSASSAILMNSLPRWLISITDMPLPCQSSSSSPARESTSAGSIAGPALKLKIRDILSLVLVDRGAGLGRRLLGALAAVAIAVAVLGFGDALEARELLALAERDQRHALRRAALLADLRDLGADQDAAGGDQHHLVVVVHEHRADERAVALGGLDRDQALAAAAMSRVLADRRPLAEAVLGRREDGFRFVVRRQHAHDALVLAELHAAHAGRLAAHRAHVG